MPLPSSNTVFRRLPAHHLSGRNLSTSPLRLRAFEVFSRSVKTKFRFLCQDVLLAESWVIFYNPNSSFKSLFGSCKSSKVILIRFSSHVESSSTLRTVVDKECFYSDLLKPFGPLTLAQEFFSFFLFNQSKKCLSPKPTKVYKEAIKPTSNNQSNHILVQYITNYSFLLQTLTQILQQYQTFPG